MYYCRNFFRRRQEQGIGTKLGVKLAAKFLIKVWTVKKKDEIFDQDHLNLGDPQV